VTHARLLQRYGILLAWVAVIALFGVLVGELFLRASNWQIIFGSQAVLVVVTLGLLLPLTAGEYDLSVAATLTFSSMLVAVLNVDHGVPIGLAVLLALIGGALVGLFNAFAIVVIGIESIIATLGTATVLQGLILWMSNQQTITGVSPTLTDVLYRTEIFGIPLAFYCALCLTIGMWYFLQYTPAGQRLLYVGRGRNVALLSGLRVNRIRTWSLVGAGVISALAGVILLSNTGSADTDSGLTFFLPAFAAAFLGSTSVTPGRFNAWGTFFAVYFLATGVSGLQLLGTQSFVQQLFYGSALLIAVSVSRIEARYRMSKAELPTDGGETEGRGLEGATPARVGIDTSQGSGE